MKSLLLYEKCYSNNNKNNCTSAHIPYKILIYYDVVTTVFIVFDCRAGHINTYKSVQLTAAIDCVYILVFVCVLFTNPQSEYY